MPQSVGLREHENIPMYFRSMTGTQVQTFNAFSQFSTLIVGPLERLVYYSQAGVIGEVVSNWPGAEGKK